MALLALLSAEPALPHVDVQPRLVEQDAVTRLRVELPRLRAGAPPVRLEVEGAGVDVVAARLREAVGAETRWSVRLRVSRAVPPGEVPLVLRAVFADGESVAVDGAITVVPPPGQSSGSFPWLGVAAGAVALGAAAAAVLVARRRN